MTRHPLHTLTPADIMDLRLWSRSGAPLGPDGTTGHHVPCLVVSPSDGTLYLHSGGRTVAGALAPHVMVALLYNERLEPGFCRAVSDPALTVEEALRTPALRLEARTRREQSDALSRAQDRLEAEARREAAIRNRRLSTPADHASLSLDDLL